MAFPNHLVIVCGHAIWLGGPAKGHDESEWLIESYKKGETPTFIEHIKAGLEVLKGDERAILIFSGGPTRPETQLSEARSYANLAAANSYFGLNPSSPSTDLGGPAPSSITSHPLSPHSPLSRRVMLEERALDSYYNILFSTVEFWRGCGAWPKRVTIVSHAFKRARLVGAHCAAIDLPPDRVAFVGINPPNLPPALLAAGLDLHLDLDPSPQQQVENELATPSAASHGAGEKEMEASARLKAEAMKGVREVVGLWEEDPHGVGEVLAGKRVQRNPWGVGQMIFASEEERARSGVETRSFSWGEALADGGWRPWRGS